MSRVRNADDFLDRFRRIRRQYEQACAPQLARIRNIYASRLTAVDLGATRDAMVKEIERERDLVLDPEKVPANC